VRHRLLAFRPSAASHLGDVVQESDGDLIGDGVNIAARFEDSAKPGAIPFGGRLSAGEVTT
jgi:class 3 adenylate cyclase